LYSRVNSAKALHYHLSNTIETMEEVSREVSDTSTMTKSEDQPLANEIRNN
jgi:hypothetical protein